ncbi:MAG TPA: winged helix-turn-helix domain-containing protein, partial [Polyangia bacterium]|nr:winged helix-turn-helix domain-containing protein [Polyangia bacterium]
HDPIVVGEGHEALARVAAEPPDLVLLDLMLPDISGTDVCRALKGDPATRHIPVVMLTAKGEEIDRVVGFELGADDYVVKPYSMRELTLRLQRILQRHSAPAESAGGVTSFGLLRIDREGHRVWVEGDEVALTALELRLLCTLYDRRGRVQTRAVLLDEVWRMSSEVNTRTVDTHVKRLREKLGAAGAYLETVRGVGYRFTGGSPDEAVAER